MEPILYRVTRPIITVLFKIIYRPVIKGKENIPTSTRVVLAGNHTNNFDCLLLISSTKRTIHFLAKDDLMKGVKKIIFKNMGIIPVNRKIHDSASLKKAKEVLNEDKVIGIFPEGTFSKVKGEILPFKIGAVKMSYDTSSKIVPFTIKGEYKPFRKGLKLEFYKPISIKDDLDLENNKLMEKIQTELKKG